MAILPDLSQLSGGSSWGGGIFGDIPEWMKNYTRGAPVDPPQVNQSFMGQPEWSKSQGDTPRGMSGFMDGPNPYYPAPRLPYLGASFGQSPVGQSGQAMPQQGGRFEEMNARPDTSMPQQSPMASLQAPMASPQGMGPPAPAFLAGAPNVGEGFGNRLFGAIQGMAGSRGLLPGLANAFKTLSTGEMTDPVEMSQIKLQQQQAALYQALRASDIPHGPALAAAMSPEAAKAILPEAFGAPKIEQTGEGPLGKQFHMRVGTKLYPIGADSGPGSIAGGGGGSDTGQLSLLAPGRRGIDSTLSGDEYVAQFGPEVRAAVKSYIKGDVMPTGNPRLQGINSFAKTVAQKWGQDTGNPVGDQIFAEKRAYRQSLGNMSANAVGGQVKAFNQGIEHMTKLAEDLKALNNYDPLGIPILAEGQNWLRQKFSTNTSAIADHAASIGQTLAGEVGKLFAGQAGGGVHERELTRQRFNTVKSPVQLAAALSATLDVMEGGLRALESARDQKLGPNHGVEFVDATTKKHIADIQETIRQLRGESKAKAAPLQGWHVQEVK